MTLSRNNFEVLNHLRKQPGSSQRDISAATGLSLGTVNKAVKQLGEESLINAGEVTPQGFEMLRPYKVDNAIILAAGLSSRFVPISYESQRAFCESAEKSLSNDKSNSFVPPASATLPWS